MIFTDGSAGLFSITEGLTQSRWVTSVKVGNPMFIINQDRTDFRLLSLSPSDVTVYKINVSDGTEAASWRINGINGNALLKTDFSDTGIFLADSQKAVLIDSEGKELWAARMPDTVKNKTVNQIVYLKDNYLVFCSKNWSMNAYHTSQSTSKYNGGKTVNKNIQADYSSFAPVDLLPEHQRHLLVRRHGERGRPRHLRHHLRRGLHGAELDRGAVPMREIGSQGRGTRMPDIVHVMHGVTPDQRTETPCAGRHRERCGRHAARRHEHERGRTLYGIGKRERLHVAAVVDWCAARHSPDHAVREPSAVQRIRIYRKCPPLDLVERAELSMDIRVIERQAARGTNEAVEVSVRYLEDLLRRRLRHAHHLEVVHEEAGIPARIDRPESKYPVPSRRHLDAVTVTFKWTASERHVADAVGGSYRPRLPK